MGMDCNEFLIYFFRWKLARQRCDSSLMMEHVRKIIKIYIIMIIFCQVLLVEFVPKQNLFKPD